MLPLGTPVSAVSDVHLGPGAQIGALRLCCGLFDKVIFIDNVGETIRLIRRHPQDLTTVIVFLDSQLLDPLR